MEFKAIDTKKFEAFLWVHMSHELKHPIVEWHRELIRNMCWPRIAMAAPRSFAKSSYFSFFYPLFLLLEQPGINILLVSATGALAEKWLYKIKTELTGNKSILHFYGDQEGDKWSNEELKLANGSTIMAKGAGKQLRGFRPDVVICDDLETDEMVISKDQRDKFDHWFDTDLTGMMLSGGQIVVVGTILHPESFLADIINHGRSGWVSRLYQAIDATWEHPLWPDQWSREKLLARKAEIGEYAFNQEYMNDPIPDESRTFQEKWFKYYDRQPSNAVYFTTIDPAIEIDDVNDCTAIVTCAVDSSENIYVVETINKRMLPSETVDAIFDVYERWKPVTMGIETVGFQKMLKFDLDRERRRRRIYPHFVELKSEGKRKSLRIEALQPWFEAGRIFIKHTQEELKTQLLRFPSPRCHDDIIDALAYILSILRPANKVQLSRNPNSFIAHLDRKRRTAGSSFVWGNHNLRGKV